MFIDLKQKLIKVDGKCHRALTSSCDKVHFMCCREDKVRQNFREALLLSHKFQKGLPCILISSEGSLVAAGSRFTPGLDQWLVPKACTICAQPSPCIT